MTSLRFDVAKETDAKRLATLRVKAMQPSLEAVGRFNQERARRRFLDTFVPADTTLVFSGKQLLGFFELRDRGDHLYLDHFYIAPEQQGRGLGSMILQWVLRDAAERDLPVRLMALKDSPANKFYRLHGFEVVAQEEFDTLYQWVPAK
ncbi:GNAT family N-acetyltransferase [Shimia sagamensis]|uniref:Acetyltransferase (GNAT) domain-containing protein n=1 Tax=Shimia sagamensis TaxID=1566352 RepID=A0ABY1P6S6_9RHOB|nr:GNAT family N-acetyltransferase [Shimia sagamensis]SMP26853.1 Acetyltransferase (GNAT) domain-containing protein [Shimia sagamensis]